MKTLADFFAKGGLPMAAIMALSVVLYSRCCKLLLQLWWSRRQLRDSDLSAPGLLALQGEAQQTFQHQRVALGAMIAAAPLLGLLGTVSGMAKTFESLGGRAGEKSMEGLARGISEVLVSTEAGLAVAIPAMILVFFAHRLARRHAETVNRLARARRSSA